MALKGIPINPDYGKQTSLVPPKGTDYSKHLASKPIVSMETMEKSIKGEPIPFASTGETVTQHPGIFTQQPGMSISIQGGRTLNLGNHESAKIGVIITVPCDATSLTDAYEWATTWVSDKIESAIKDAKGM
jgi:hypothetical protein